MQLGQMLQESRDREAALETRLQGVGMAGQSIGPAIQVLAASQAELANAMKRNEKKTMTLIDNRGVGKIPIKDDGRTPYQKLSGRKWNRPLVRFGERIFFRPLDARKVDDGATGERKSGDLGRRVMSGYYVGTHGRNADVLVMMTQGVVKGNTVHRRPETERWDRSEKKDLRGVPWLLRPREAGDLEHRLYIALPEAMQTLTPAV